MAGSWFAELQREDLIARAGAQRLWRVLETVVRRLDTVGVEVAAIKGITTEARWYGRPGERPCDDLDVLVGPSDLSRVDEIVEVLHPAHPLRTRLPELVRSGALSAITLAVEGVPVDLHFDLLQLGIPLRNAGRIWERTLPFPLPEGGVVRVLDPETALVHLLLNLNKDRFARLLGYVDIARLLEHEQVDWDLVDEMVRAEGLQTPVYLTLEAVCTTLGIPAPPAVVPRGVRADLWRLLWRPSVRLHGGISRTRFRHRQHMLAFVARRRAPDALRLWWRLLFPPPSLVRYAFPGETGRWLWRITGRRAVRIWGRRRQAPGRRTVPVSAAHDPWPLDRRGPETFGASFVPVLRATVVRVEVDGEVVLFDEATGALCLLDPVATVALACFDGASAVDDVAADLAIEFGADERQVLDDVICLAGRLAGEGMLEV